MHKVLEYGLFYAALLLLQVFLFDNLAISSWLAPLPYVAFLIMLPLNTPHGLMVILGFLAGFVLDICTGTGGLHTIAATLMGFVRPGMLNVTMGRDFWREAGGALTRKDLRSGRWLRCSALLTLIHCAVYFIFEAMTWKYFGHTLLKITVSSAATILLVWFIGYIYPVRK